MPHFDLSSPRVEERNGVRCLSTNTDCLFNKVNEIELFLNVNDIDIASFTETMPKNCNNVDLRNVQINLKGYTCLSNFIGRGVCLYIKNEYEILERLNHIEELFSPSIICRVKYHEEVFVMGVTYRSPSSSADDNGKFVNQINTLSKYLQDSNERLVLVGDFNYPEIDWVNEFCDKPPNHPACQFLNSIHFNFLKQYVDRPTHFRALQEPTLIDLIISNVPDFNNYDFIHSIKYLPPFGKSHHSVICFKIDLHKSVNKDPSVSKYSFNKGNYDAMRGHFKDTDWEAMLEGDDIDKSWNLFENSLNGAMKLYIPTYISKNVHKHSFDAPSTLLYKIQLKREAFRNFKRFPSNVNYSIYTKYRNQVVWESRKAKKEKEKKIAKLSKSNPKAFYQYVNSKVKPRENVSSLLKDDGTLTRDDLEKSEVLNDFFSSVFTLEDTNSIPVFKCNNDVFISTTSITQLDMEKALMNLNVNKSPGPDGLHPRVLRELASVLSYPLKILFDKTITLGRIPTKWKVAEVRPIFKKGKRTSPGNYRPVSLTSIICKVFERFIKDTIFKHLIDNNLLSDDQFGFCSGRSCTTQLLSTIYDWFSELDNNVPVDAIYLDFRKAFDAVPHLRLINKLYGYGIRGQLLEWIKDFLSERYQYVTINDKSSKKCPVTSGVPQGSVLGPTLFIYYINDLPTVVTALIKIFADDTKAYKAIRSLIDKNILQKSIDNMVEWSDIWQIGFNGSKCKVLHIGKNNPCYEYTIKENGVTKTLDTTESEKDLGVFIDPLLSFKDHILFIVKKARSLSGLIIRSIEYKCIDNMVPLFKSIVRPILETSEAVWNPYMRKFIDMVESVQRHFTKYVIGMRDLSYEERMKSLKLPSLEFRRFRGDMIEIFKICHNL